MDVIVNKDLTKKVLAALNPNKIFDEDQLEKQTALTRIMRPFGESEEEKASQVIEESKKGVDSSIAKKLGKAARNLFKSPKQKKFEAERIKRNSNMTRRRKPASFNNIIKKSRENKRPITSNPSNNFTMTQR